LETIDLKKFPSTRYQGSKRKMLPWINEVVKEFDFNSVLDGFGGTGSVSYLFKKLNKQITFNDVLKFNSIIGKAIIENSEFILSDVEVETFLKFENYRKSKHFIEKSFKDIYYLDEENKWLDKIINEINLFQSGKTKKEVELKRAIAFYSIFQSCLIKRPFNLFHRKNLNLRTNENVIRSFGNKTTWDRSFPHYFKKFCKEANNLVFSNGQNCKSLNQSIFDVKLNNNSYDLVYLDPPYIKTKGSNETADYLRCYHFLEGISIYSEWKEMINEATINKRFHKDYLDEDFNEKNILKSFEKIFEKYQKSIIILSYKFGGTPSIDKLVELLGKFKENTVKKSIHYKYALNHQNGDMKFNREFLIIGY